MPDTENSSIAVLPFVNTSGDTDREYFAEGFTDELISTLGHAGGVPVIAYNSVMAYRGREVDAGAASSELGARFVVQGTVGSKSSEAGNPLEVTARLVDGTTEKELWTDRFDRKVEDVAAIQSEIAKMILAKIGREN